MDAGNLVGTGHLMEILSVIKGLERKMAFSPVVITTRNAFAVKRLQTAGMEDIRYLPPKISEEDEAKKIIAILKNSDCDNLVIDLLNRSNRFYARLKRGLKKTFVILDDSEHHEIPATAVVNFSITQDPLFRNRISRYGTKYLIGPAYFPIDASLEKRSPIKIKKIVKRIFVNQGGSDPYGLTGKILRALEKLRLPQEVDVILGGALKECHKNEIKNLKNSLKGDYRFFSTLSRERLYDLLEKSDLAISAAGNTLYELAFLGIPTLIISHHKRHDIVASAFARKDAAVNLGIGNDLSEAYIAEGAKRIIKDYPKRSSLNQKARRIMRCCKRGALARELACAIKGS